MSLQAFSFPFPETRLFQAGSFIYRFKIRGGNSYSGEEVMGEDNFNQELEEIVRTVLGNLDSLQPFSSAHYTIFPYKKRWEGAGKHSERNLRVYPFILVLYLEKNMQNGEQAEEEKEVIQHIPSVSEPQSKRCKRDSPLEEAILKDLIADMEAGGRVSVTSKVNLDSWHTEGEVFEDPGHTDKNETRGVGRLLLKSGVNMIGRSGSPGEVQPETMQDTDEEEEEEEEETPGTPVRPGILMRLASHIFPFSLFFKDP